MFFHTARLQFESKPDKPDPVYARTSCRSCPAAPTGEMTVAMQYLFQAWKCRMPGYRASTKTAATKAAAVDPAVGAVLGGMESPQAIAAGGGALLRRLRSDAIARRHIAYRTQRD